MNSKENKLYVVRYYDAFDGWVDVKKACSLEEANAYYQENTEGDTVSCEKNKAPMGEYFKIFPANTTMMVRPETLGRD